MVYLYLGLAIFFEVVATSFLKLTEGFTNLWPSVIVVVGYGLAFYFLGLTLKHLPIGITYAIWAGLGIILLAIIGMVFFKQVPDMAAWIGMALILAGVVVIQVFSKTSAH
ncbi:multidrug efflux SMR transporter [Thiomicrorhabdus sp.]|uniref:DMT family transporter n=1 Tax=Thiomicrorhabdus sp. TaxID=2039724 RepID=UPI002AA62093|nr:multidrug efflux SMR transporter [Thiomicrorhabdus sp.]